MATYRFLRWDITRRKGSATDSVQIGEFEVRNSGVTQSWPGGTTVTPAYWGSNVGEGPANLIDGTTSKYRDFGFRYDSIVVIDTGAQDAITFDGYRFYTSSAADDYDPVSWVLEGSFDGSTYTVLDRRDLYSPIPTGSSVATDTFALPNPVAFRYLRWRITHVRQREAADSVAAFISTTMAQELELLLDGTPLAWPGGTVATNPSGSNPAGKGPGELVDGVTGSGSEWWDEAAKTNGSSQVIGLSRIVIDCGVGNSVTFNAYRYRTANDVENRDPTGWALYGSNDGTSWDLLDTRVAETITSSRDTFTSDFTIGRVEGSLGEVQIIGTTSLRHPTRPGNLLSDPSFEAGSTIPDWVPDSGLFLEQWKGSTAGLFSRTGFASMAMYNTSTPISIVAKSPEIAVTPGGVYEITFWAMRTASHGILGGITPRIHWLRNGQFAGDSSGALVKLTGGVFKLVRVSGRAPDDATHLRLGISHGFPVAGDVLYIDDVHIGLSAATTSFSGGSPSAGDLLAVGPNAEAAFTAQNLTAAVLAALGPNAEAAFTAEHEGARLDLIGPAALASFIGDTIAPNEAELEALAPAATAALTGDPARPELRVQPVDVRPRRGRLGSRVFPVRWRESGRV